MAKILLIEDHEPMRENIALLLRLNGYEVCTAEDGMQGLRALDDELPDLVLCDVMMPVLDGYGVLEAMRQSPAQSAVPFVFLTAKGEKKELRAGMILGADDYLSKPVSESDLLETVRARLERSSLVQAAARRQAAAKPDFSSATPLLALGLTPREAEVLLWIAQGKSNAEIAGILGMSEPTAKKHASNLFEKLGCESRSAASLLALEALLSKPKS